MCWEFWIFTKMQLSSHSLSDRVPLGCTIFANFLSPTSAVHPTRTGNPISDWDKRLLCSYKSSLSIDVGTKYTSYKNFSSTVTGLQRVQYFRLNMLHFGANLWPSFFSAPCKTGLLNYYMQRRNSITEQIFLCIRGEKSTPGVISRPNKSFKLSGHSSRTLHLKEDYLLVVSRFRKKFLITVQLLYTSNLIIYILIYFWNNVSDSHF
jgi:hypothetical protein